MAGAESVILISNLTPESRVFIILPDPNPSSLIHEASLLQYIPTCRLRDQTTIESG